MQFLQAALFVASLLSGVEAAKKTFNFTLTEGFAAPDGFIRKYTLINGITPGPVIEVNQGDDVEIFVTNTVVENATVHFHGMQRSPI